jgi:hypothetical protein
MPGMEVWWVVLACASAGAQPPAGGSVATGMICWAQRSGVWPAAAMISCNMERSTQSGVDAWQRAAVLVASTDPHGHHHRQKLPLLGEAGFA